jgi:Sulfotransferase family
MACADANSSALYVRPVGVPNSRPVHGLADGDFVFIACMNNSGSTLLHRYLKACSNAVSLPLEGQSLVPGTAMSLPWEHGITRLWTEQSHLFDGDGRYDWNAIREIWFDAWRSHPNYGSATPLVYLEKSPPNVLRAELLQREFPPAHFLVMVRDPYAATEGVSRTAKCSVARAVEHWVAASRKQVENIESLGSVLWFRYEDLCRDPAAIAQRIREYLPQLSDVSFSVAIDPPPSVDPTVGSGVRDLNDRQLHNLTPRDMETITTRLAREKSLLDYFGYSLRV